MFERLHDDYPTLILQQCACGGARNDLGTASRFHESYLSDGLWMPQLHQIYSGMTVGLPPESLVIAVGAVTEKSRGRPANLDTYLRTSFTLSTPQPIIGVVSPRINELSSERRDRYRHYIDLYKRFMRPMWPTSRMFHHEPVNDTGGVMSRPWFAVEFASENGAAAWATIVRTGPDGSDTYRLRPRGLDVGKSYRVTLDSSGQVAQVSGWELVRDGVAIRIGNVLGSELVLFEAQ